ncbi:MAG: ATP-binding protein [Leptolyngbyaceae cyanobacterium bins.349]|nr:ATP-binding protein [Leptolyngbyaceae cyanobacterium bins.349]
MSSSSQFIDNRILSASIFERLALVIQEFAEGMAQAIVLTEVAFPSLSLSLKRRIHRFTVVATPEFNALLVGQLVQQETEAELDRETVDSRQSRRDPTSEGRYITQLSFEPTAIATFLAEVQQELPSTHPLHQRLALTMQTLRPNDGRWQAEFSLRLAEVFYLPPSPAVAPSPHPKLIPESADQPEQDTVINKVATQIRQTQELSLILQTAVQQIRTFLQVERVVIYQFESVIPAGESLQTGASGVSVVCGRVTYEDRANATIPRVLNLSEGMQCFIGMPDYQEKYRKGTIQVIEDVQVAYANTPCLVDFLAWAHIRSKLVVPIVFQEELWGLLIAHQCSNTRHWQESEVRFLRCMADLLAIAIYQTQLYSQLQRQAQTLEQRVIERTQELYDAVDAAQSANISKTEFLATVSHELRTPLTAIIGMSTTLLRLPTDARREQLLPLEKQQEYLKIIRNSGEHLLELINDIIDLSQVEAGRAILDVQQFSLAQIGQDSIRMLRDKAQHNQIKLELKLQLDEPGAQGTQTNQVDRDRFAADPRRVKQILLNLLSNAIKFTPPGGQVTLRIWVEAGHAVFQIEDTGIGIPKHQFPLLFKKFQQLDRSYDRQYEGTGLGLALTKQLVELHGGRIDVDSVVERGSTFTVWLPAQPLKSRILSEANQSVNPSLLPVPPSVRVVLIENQETTANLICDLLTVAGHQVIWMVDGMTALHQIEIIKPEVALIGSQLMSLSPAEILQQLRQNPSTQRVKVLLLSQNDQDSDRWLAAGADACLTMPLQRPEELLGKVQELIDGQE